MYCAALPPIFAAVHRVLRDGGMFAFSVERHRGEDAQMLQASLRYAHNGDAVRQALTQAGFELVSVCEETIRRERGQPVEGLLFVARKPDGADVSSADIGEAEADYAPASLLH
jgi:predicted TPR repeat methyltransferase